MQDDPTITGRWRALNRRWWIEYNPLALASAALVLGGLTLLGQAPTIRAGSSVFALSAVAEVYALCLIGGAALLYRTGRRRAAVILALLAVPFQADLTLHVETSAYRGVDGIVAAPAWFLVFVFKAWALCRALRLGPRRSTWTALLLGAAGLAVFPALALTWGRAMSPSVTLWLFGVVAIGLWFGMEVRTRVPLDVRGHRALRFSWGVGILALVAHAVVWVEAFRLDAVAWPAAGALLASRACRTEKQHWALVGGTLLMTLASSPHHLSLVFLMAAASLALNAWKNPPRRAITAPLAESPYRAPGGELTTSALHAAARVRMQFGALFALYGATWSGSAWDAGPGSLPSLAALVGLSVVVACWAAHRRHPGWLLALVPVHLEALAAAGAIRPPAGAIEWGATALTLGFVALVASMAVQLRAGRPGEGPDPVYARSVTSGGGSQ